MEEEDFIRINDSDHLEDECQKLNERVTDSDEELFHCVWDESDGDAQFDIDQDYIHIQPLNVSKNKQQHKVTSEFLMDKHSLLPIHSSEVPILTNNNSNELKQQESFTSNRNTNQTPNILDSEESKNQIKFSKSRESTEPDTIAVHAEDIKSIPLDNQSNHEQLKLNSFCYPKKFNQTNQIFMSFCMEKMMMKRLQSNYESILDK